MCVSWMDGSRVGGIAECRGGCDEETVDVSFSSYLSLSLNVSLFCFFPLILCFIINIVIVNVITVIIISNIIPMMTVTLHLI